MKNKLYTPSLFVLIGITLPTTACSAFGQTRWNKDQIATLRSLGIGSLPPLPADPSNKYANNPEAASFGQKLFFDTHFSSNGEVACAT